MNSTIILSPPEHGIIMAPYMLMKGWLCPRHTIKHIIRESLEYFPGKEETVNS